MATGLKECKTITDEMLDGLQEIGGGSFGSIYRAWHKDWCCDVAVKKLNSNFSQGLQELLSEARMMDMALPITYVIRIYGLYQSVTKDGRLCHGIVMEYLENGSLASLLQRVNPLPLELKIRILHEVSLGMNRLHSLEPPLLHLDLKPSNILLDTELHVRIADFGLSRFKRGASLVAGVVEDYGGTLEYMPPESLNDDVNYRPTQVFDVYSYGILMWAVLTGSVPYSAAPHEVIKLRIPLGDRPDMNLVEEVAKVEKMDELKALMQSCWHKETSKRPTFKECSMDLENIWTFHRAGIIPAVRKVQDILLKMVTTSREYSGTKPVYAASNRARHSSAPSSVATSNSHMSQMVEEFVTLHVTEAPSLNLGAEPIGTSPAPKALPAKEETPTPARYSKPRYSKANKTPKQAVPTTPLPHPSSQYNTGYPYHPSMVQPPQPYQPWMFQNQPQNSYPPFPYPTPGSVHISGSIISGIQVGNHNSMTISSQQKEPKNKKKR